VVSFCIVQVRRGTRLDRGKDDGLSSAFSQCKRLPYDKTTILIQSPMRCYLRPGVVNVRNTLMNVLSLSKV
jgi:hypothetical protein